MNKIIDGVVYLDLDFYSPEVFSKIKKKLNENQIPNSYFLNECFIFNLDKSYVKSNSNIKFNHNLKTYN